MRGVHTSVGAARHYQPQWLSSISLGNAQNCVQSILDSALNRAPIRLASPAEESAAIVGEVKAKSCHAIHHRGDLPVTNHPIWRNGGGIGW